MSKLDGRIEDGLTIVFLLSCKRLPGLVQGDGSNMAKENL